MEWCKQVRTPAGLQQPIRTQTLGCWTFLKWRSLSLSCKLSNWKLGLPRSRTYKTIGHTLWLMVYSILAWMYKSISAVVYRVQIYNRARNIFLHWHQSCILHHSFLNQSMGKMRLSNPPLLFWRRILHKRLMIPDSSYLNICGSGYSCPICFPTKWSHYFCPTNQREQNRSQP